MSESREALTRRSLQRRLGHNFSPSPEELFKGLREDVVEERGQKKVKTRRRCPLLKKVVTWNFYSLNSRGGGGDRVNSLSLRLLLYIALSHDNSHKAVRSQRRVAW